jgi:hypothetical protein
MVLRLCVVLALILGIYFWISGINSGGLVNIHMILGILVVLSLWVLGIIQATTKGGNWSLAIGAIILGLIIAGFGMAQNELLKPPSVHWIIQVIHLLLGLGAAGLGESIARRYKRLSA